MFAGVLKLHSPAGAERSSSFRISSVAAMPPMASRIKPAHAQDTAAQQSLHISCMQSLMQYFAHCHALPNI